jgi:branched-chain amino acid transport system permease protein
MIYAILALGLDLLMGWSRQFAFAQMAFFGIGCYATAILKLRFDVPFLIGLPTGAIAAAGVGIIVAYPATRLRSIYLALATFAFAEGARWVYASWDSVTGGTNGLRLPVMSVVGVEIVGDRQAFPVITVLTALVVLATMMITTSRFGRAMVAVRESEHVALASGVDVRAVKVSAFAMSALYSGLAGGIYALDHSFVSPNEFGFAGAVVVLSMIVVGGMGSIPGALLGVVLIGLLPVLLQTALRSLQLWQELIYGLILTLAVMFMPRGVWGAIMSLRQRGSNRRPLSRSQERRA